jgi:hypothetical protein
VVESQRREEGGREGKRSGELRRVEGRDERKRGG